MIKYLNYSVTFQEVPNEISLCFNITNCQYHCPGCHSPELWEDIGEDLEADLVKIIKKYLDGISCVCLLGDGNDPEGLQRCFAIIRKQFPQLKTCLYSGEEYCGNTTLAILLATGMLDYLKIGPYIEECGPLNDPKTNQRMYKVYLENDLYIPRLEDITSLFWKKGSI